MPCTSNFVLSLACTCSGTAVHLSPNHCLPCTCSGTAMHLSLNLVTIRNLKTCSDTASNFVLSLPCTSNFVLSLTCTCSGTSVHLSPSLVSMLYVYPCFGTAMHLYFCLVIALHLQRHRYAPLTLPCH